MSLNHGPLTLAIPGPSVMPERVLRAMHRASPNIYEGELIDLVDGLFPDLKAVARTQHHVALYIANGHGAWEASLANTLVAGDRVLVLATGRFGPGWAEMAEKRGIIVETLDFGMHAAADPQTVEDFLRKPENADIKAVLTVQADTATSVINDIPALREAITSAGHDALYMVDCIASLGCDRFEMDEWGVDLMVAGCQKGLMTPPGMAFVYFNDKANEARKRCEPGGYWDWTPRFGGEYFYQKFGGTAPTHHLYGLREALTMLVHEEGMENVWARHETIAHAIWDAVDAWGTGQNSGLHHNIEDRKDRSRAVSTIATGPDDAKRLREWCENQAGLTLGIGLGFGEPNSNEWNRRFRIGHMGHQNVPMTMGALGTIQTALQALAIPHGSGALEAAGARLATHGQG
ncbi:MAG: aminotransferase class V-fold PLP-dependent enzyme [Pseudomonadota bacterium]